jgi:hypothetical protein
VLLYDHVAEVDPDAKPDPSLLRHLRLTVNHSALDLRSAADSIDHARKLCQEAVASVLYDPAPVLADLWIDQFPEVGLEPLVRPFLIRSHQPRVARHIGGEDGGEAADRGHGLSGGKVGLTEFTPKPAAALGPQ